MLNFKDITTRKEIPLREKFIRGDIFCLGQMVEDDSGQYQILDRGTNYVTCSDSKGNLVKKFISEVTSLPQRAAQDSVNNFKGLVTTITDPIVLVCFESTIDKYTKGTIVDAIAIIKALKAYYENDTTSLRTSLTRINELDNHIYLKETMADNIKQTTMDRLKVAAVIADTLGAKSNGSSPEIMVNAALQNARKNSNMLRGESMKIILRMLELAKSVGIKYDENIIKMPMEESELDEHIVKTATGYRILSKTTGKNLGDFTSIDGAKNHERQIEYFKHQNESEHLDELSLDTLRKASDATHTMPPKSVSHAVKRFGSADKTQGKLHTAELKRMSGELKEGKDVCITHDSGKKMYGKVKGHHGSVVEVQYNNGKIGFHHNHKCSLLNELDPITEADQLKTFSDITQKNSKPEDTAEQLKTAIDYSAGKGETVPDEILTHASKLKGLQGNTLGSKSDTVRKMMVNKLMDN